MFVFFTAVFPIPFAVTWQIISAVVMVKLFVESIVGLAKKPKIEENETYP